MKCLSNVFDIPALCCDSAEDAFCKQKSSGYVFFPFYKNYHYRGKLHFIEKPI